MKNLVFLFLSLFFNSLNIFGQGNLSYSEEINNFVFFSGDTTPEYTVYGGATSENELNIVYINNIRYENLLLGSTTPTQKSIVDLVKLSDNYLVIGGRTNIISSVGQVTIALYALPSVSLVGYLRFNNLTVGANPTVLLKDGNNIHFQISGLTLSSWFESSFGNVPTSSATEGEPLTITGGTGTFTFDTSNNSIVNQNYAINGTSKAMIKKGNVFYETNLKGSPRANYFIKRNSNLSIIGITPIITGDAAEFIKDFVIVNENGTDYAYLYAYEPNSNGGAPKGIRKINCSTMTMVPDNQFVSTSNFFSIVPATAVKIIHANDRISVLFSGGNLDQAIINFNYNGDIVDYKKIMANTATMAASNLRGLGMSTAYFDHGQNKIMVKGFTGRDADSNNDLFYGQEIPFGTRFGSMEYIPLPNPDSDMTMSVTAFPNAVITRDKNSFYIDGIPESAWGSITLQIAHVNPSTPFIISEGGGLTKDFINNPVNRFGSYLNFGPTASYTWEYSLYSVRMGSALSNENPQLEEKAILFPNPTSGTLYVSEKIMNNYDSVEIFDISGRLISNTKLTSEISLHDNPPGLYMIKMFNSETGVSEIKKILKK